MKADRAGAAERNRRYRQRLRRDRIVLQVEADQSALVDALFEAGLISEETEDRATIAAATARFLEACTKSVTRLATKDAALAILAMKSARGNCK